ncbi:glycosyltransferase family 39 protein [Chloroflexus sp.]|uniref:glycosyltransferase family 39 protein n=1 Tax=Chloroflexus sp. TaxID=1904827 RepID=UPI00298EE89B|nr:glycosyltransferase family 39 protein [Chloroflexus sp.]MDW8403355.1 glycosyltransferase family 39 protein [Chloroflexus sp.]
MIRSLARPTLSFQPALLLPAALTILAAGLLLFVSPRSAHYWRVGEDHEPVLVGFHGNEQNETDLFRWSQPQAALFLYGYRGAPALVELRLAAPRQPGTPPAKVAFACQDGALGTITVAGYWRRYRFLIPTTATGETVLQWSTDPYVALPDVRELGVALSGVKQWPLAEHPPLSAQTISWSVLPLVVWAAGAVWRWPAHWRDVVAGLALLPAIGLALLPATAEYWLPTVPWPWWPLLPALVIVAWPALAAVRRSVVQWVAAQPVASWMGLVVAGVSLLALRAGAPVWLALPSAIIGVGLAWPLIAERDDVSLSLWPIGRSLAAITGVALVVRLVALDQMPPALWRDESRHGLLALQIWVDPTFRPIYVPVFADLPALLFYLMAPAVGILGPHAWSARLVSAVAGALTPLALYWFAAPLIGRRAAVLGAALLAWASWSVSMSRWAFPATLDHLLVLAAAGLLWRGLDPARHGWRVWLHVAGAAILGGLAVYTYHTGRLAPLALLVVALVRLGRDLSHWRVAWPRVLLAALIGAMVIAPLVWYVLTDSTGFNRRVGSVSIFQADDLARHRPLDFLAEHIVRYGLMWHAQGEANGRHHLPLAPMVDPVVGLLLLIGLGIAWRARRTAAVVVVVFWLLYYLPGLLSFNAPHAMRSLGTLAPACALAGWGLSRLAAGAPWRRWLIPAALAASLAVNLWVYFGLMWHDPRVYGEFDRVETVMAQIARRAAAHAVEAQTAVPVYLPREWVLSDTVRFLTSDLAPADRPRIWRGVLDSHTDALVVLPAFADPAEVDAVLNALGPAAVEVTPTPTIPADSAPLVRVFARGAAALALLRSP